MIKIDYLQAQRNGSDQFFRLAAELKERGFKDEVQF